MHPNCRGRRAELERIWLAEENAAIFIAEASKKVDKKKEQEKKEQEKKNGKQGEKVEGENEVSRKAEECAAASIKKAKDPTAYNPKSDPNNIWEVGTNTRTRQLAIAICLIPPSMNDTCPEAVCPGHSFTQSRRRLECMVMVITIR